MALYFMQQPQKYHPAYNDIIFVTSGTNNTQTNYQYILDVWLTGASIYSKRFKVPSRPDGYGVFDISEFIRQYVTQDIAIATTPEAVKQNLHSWVSYDIKLGEEYGTSGTVYSAIATSGTYYAFNACYDPLDYVDYNQSNYIAQTTSRKFLTNTNNTSSATAKPVRSTEREWLHFICNGSGNLVSYVYYSSDTGSGNLTNTFSTVITGDQMFLRIPAGPQNIGSTISSIGTTYSITLRDSTNQNVSETRYFIVRDYCSKYDSYRIHFLNKLGGFDSFTFNAVSKQSSTIDRQKYKKLWGAMSGSNWIYSKSDIQEQTFSTIIKDKLIINSDWISEAESTWLEELITSPVVYWDNDGTLIPLTITNSGYERKKTENEKMFNLVLEVEFTYNRYRQG
jgi:hypothetical protein